LNDNIDLLHHVRFSLKIKERSVFRSSEAKLSYLLIDFSGTIYLKNTDYF